MTMHHATRKKAHDAGIHVSEVQNDDGGYTYEAGTERSLVISSNAKEVVAAVMIFEQIASPKEYPFVRMSSYSSEVMIFIPDPSVPDENIAATEGTDVEDVWVAFCEEHADTINEIAEALGDEEDSGSIVHRKYRDEYKARGDATRCSDMFCELLDPLTRTIDAKGKAVADLEATREIALANDIDRDWPTLNKGQRCMNWRNMIRSKVKKTGVLVLPGKLTGNPDDTTHTFPEWLPES